MKNIKLTAKDFKNEDRSLDQNGQLLGTASDLLFKFHGDIRISKKSVYSDTVWDWVDDSNLRLAVHKSCELTLDWDHFMFLYNLTPSIVEDLKKYACLRILLSKLIFPKTEKNGHPKVVINEVRVFSAFLRHLRSQLAVGNSSLICELSDIEMQDLHDCFVSFQLAKTPAFKATLNNFASDLLWAHFGFTKAKWTISDITTLPWKKKERVPTERLSEDLFCFLSNKSIADVRNFLSALNIKSHDETVIQGEDPLFLHPINNFNEIFEGYRQYLRADDRNDFEDEKFLLLVEECATSLNEIARVVERASLAARVVITLYTGARGSELTCFRCGSLRFKEDTWVILGTVIKHIDLNAPTDKDEWVASPIVRDAAKLLEETARLYDSQFLFHPFKRVLASALEEKPIHHTELTRQIRKYFGIIDSDNQWEGIKISPHQFRNNLVYEMRKASLGLPFISYQLKHVYDALGKTVNDVTLGYGDLASSAVEKAITDANLVALRELYHPDSPVAGGGAAQHKRRRETYFEAMVHRGFGVDEVLLELAVEGGMPLTDVGLGYCQGSNKKILDDDGNKVEPPCIGSLRCNPVQCKNAVIPKHKLPAWEKILEENSSRAEDPNFAHVREYLLEAAEEAQSVLEFLKNDH